MKKTKAPSSYLKSRLEAIDITESRNAIEVRNPHDNRPYKAKFFTEDDQGNLVINYFTFDGHPLILKDGRTQYSRTRFANLDKNKYKQPFGSAVEPFFCPKVIKAHRDGTPIDTLYITEGELKAFSLDNQGIFAIGIGGIFSFKDKETGLIHPDIARVIELRHVKNLVLLFDADALKVEWKEKTDLWQRLNQFYTAVKNFNELVKPLNIDLYFAHVHEKWMTIAKGIDDLIYHKDATAKDIVKELGQLAAGDKREYVRCLHITGNSTNNIQRYFSVDSVNTFWDNYRSKLEGRDFIYKNEIYFWDDVEEKLKVSFYNEARNYMRVATNFYKKIYVVNAHGTEEIVLMEWTIGEILRDHNKSVAFVNQIPKYDSFANLPCHTKDYKRVIEIKRDGTISRLYNRYHPITHDIKEGPWPNIEKFLKHIFNYENCSGENLLNFGLDYIQLLFTNPTLRLPVICLVSAEKNTGKSTFLEFLRLIFKENATILDNERFTGKFTSHFTDKLVIGLDEGWIPIEQKLMKERIKSMSTGKTVWLESKGKNAIEVDYFGKLIICSNDETDFMQIDGDENRFAVIKVSPLKDDDPNILRKMKEEIGHFLHYITNRQLFYSGDQSRFWFHKDVYITPAMLKVAERTKQRYQVEIDDLLEEHFLNFKKEVLHYTSQDIIELLRKEANYNFASKPKIRTYLSEIKKVKQEKNVIRYYIHKMLDDSSDDSILYHTESKTGRPFIISYKNILKPDDWPDFEKTMDRFT